MNQNRSGRTSRTSELRQEHQGIADLKERH